MSKQVYVTHPITFEEFLAYIREHVGKYCGDEYWRMIYDGLKRKTLEHVRAEVPYLAIHAVATHYSATNG